MKKIKTIFNRDWEGTRKVVDEPIVASEILESAKATEKLDGMNVRLTVRNHTLVRLEKRRNPDKIQKHKGIEEPWYVDASEGDPGDRYIFDAAKNTDLSDVPDGEWSGEAIGPDIQGNTISLEKRIVVLFSLGKAPELGGVPTGYEGLKAWLPLQRSRYGNGPMEGIVWHCSDGTMYKIKTKDF